MLQSFWIEKRKRSEGSMAGANGIRSGLSDRSRSAARNVASSQVECPCQHPPFQVRKQVP